MIVRLTTCAALALGLMAAPAFAAESPHSGNMSKNEAALQDSRSTEYARLAARFTELDTDKDGEISQREWTALETKTDASPQFSAINQNQDGMITRAEWDTFFQNQQIRQGATSGEPVSQ